MVRSQPRAAYEFVRARVRRRLPAITTQGTPTRAHDADFEGGAARLVSGATRRRQQQTWIERHNELPAFGAVIQNTE
jgi:hypothetical protein